MAILDLKGLGMTNMETIRLSKYLYNELVYGISPDKDRTTEPPRSKIKCTNCGATKIKNKDCEYCGT